jgi:hypothetical protein
MKITIPGTDLFEEKLNEKIQLAVNEEIQKVDKNVKYSFCLEFDETLIYCKESIEEFTIPDEKLPQYQRGKVLHGDDKMYAILSYQLKEAEEAIEHYGIFINHASIEGCPFVEIDCVNIRLLEQEEKELKSDKKSKNGRPLKCNVIMPSITGFARNIYNFYEKLEKERDTALEKAFDSKDLYEKYKVLVGKDEIYKIYQDFNREYGDMWTYSKGHRVELIKKFLQTVKIEAGLITNEKTKSEVMKPLVIPAITIFELQVYKKTKTENGVRKYIGQISLRTNGKIVKIEYYVKRKNYNILNGIFDDCYLEINDKFDNYKLVNSIRELVKKANLICENYGFSLDQDTMDNVLNFIDIKRLIKKARQA